MWFSLYRKAIALWHLDRRDEARAAFAEAEEDLRWLGFRSSFWEYAIAGPRSQFGPGWELRLEALALIR